MRTVLSAGSAAFFAACILLVAGCRNSPHPELRAAESRLREQRYEEAMAAADRYLREHPGGAGAAEATYLKARSIEQRAKRSPADAETDLAQARALYQEVLKLQPPGALRGYVNASLGNVCFWQGDYPAAETYCREAFKDLYNHELKALVLYRQGLSQQRLGRWDDADGTFATLQERYPGSQPAAWSSALRGVRGFYVQAGAFGDTVNAERLVARLREQGFAAVRVHKPERKLHFVMVGPMRNHADATTMQSRMHAQGFKDTLIVP